MRTSPTLMRLFVFAATALLFGEMLAVATAASSGLVCGASDIEGAYASIACPSDSVIVGIPFASYGLPTGACPNYVSDPVCESSTILGIVAGICVGRNNCSVPQVADKFGPLSNPTCNPVYKRLRLVAECAPLVPPSPPIVPLPALPPSHTYVCGTTPEWHQTTISCPSGSVVVRIPFASYGLPTGVCPNYAIDPNCHSTAIMHIANSRCLTKNSCTIDHASQLGTLGDPCVYLNKRIIVVVECAPASSLVA